MNKLPICYSLVYGIDEVKKTFVQYKLTASNRALLPDLIRLEENNGYNSISGANTLLKIRDASNWKLCTITGLRPTNTANFYYADLIINKKKSLIICYISTDKDVINLLVCPEWYPLNPNQRESIVSVLIEKLKKGVV